MLKSSDRVGTTFVNEVVGRGIWNNVVNIQFATYQFSPDTENGKVEFDPVVSCRLRMDRVCAETLHKALGDLLTSIQEAEHRVVAGLPAEPTAPEKPN